MTRKFKAWDKVKKRWLTDYEEVYVNTDGRAFILVGSNYNGDALVYVDVDIVWWTGLKDKNGVDIYEGDVLQTIAHDGTKLSIFEIYWCESSCSFKKIRGDGEKFGLTIHQTLLTIIGNKFQNPELIKN